MKETIIIEDASIILDKNWLNTNVSQLGESFKLSKINIWYYFDEKQFEIKELKFDEVDIYNWIQGDAEYSFVLNEDVIPIGFPTFAPTITELKTKLLIDIRNRIEEIDVEKQKLIERTEEICEL